MATIWTPADEMTDTILPPAAPKSLSEESRRTLESFALDHGAFRCSKDMSAELAAACAEALSLLQGA